MGAAPQARGQVVEAACVAAGGAPHTHTHPTLTLTPTPPVPPRFELYRKYLEALLERDSEAGVILTDSRDVLIQSDPWEHPLVQQLIDEVGAARLAWWVLPRRGVYQPL